MKRLLTLQGPAALMLWTPLAAAQNGAGTHAPASISESTLRHHIGVIADDSMLGRDTPSRGLELTARYIAENFRRFGLQPGGDSGGFLQRYRISAHLVDAERSSVTLAVGSSRVTVSLKRDAHLVSGPHSGRDVTGEAVLVGGGKGVLDSALVNGAHLAGRVVLFATDFSRSAKQLNLTYLRILAQRPRAVVFISNRDPGAFTALVNRQAAGGVGLDFGREDDPMVVEVQERAIAGVLAAARVHPATVRASAAPVFRTLPQLAISLNVSDVAGTDATAPNVIGILPGTDPVLRHEYVVFSAHMDHVGVHETGTADSIWNGADDDASGTAGVLALAEAFARMPTRRSIIFLTVSGEEKGLWGSEWFTTYPPVPMSRIVADINLDMIGRNWKDTIVVIGKEHSDLGSTLNAVNAAHPELGMSAIDDIWPQESFYYRSDHYNFAKHGVPILFLFNGTHADYHEPGDSPDKIDAEKESRIVKLVFYLGQVVGNAPNRPKWNPESYRKIVQPDGR